MDDAWVGSIDVSIKKAKTALFFAMATGQIGAGSVGDAAGQSVI